MMSAVVDDDVSPFFLSHTLSLLKNCSQPALAMPFAKSFSTLVSLAVVFLFAQRLPTRMVAAARPGHWHD